MGVRVIFVRLHDLDTSCNRCGVACDRVAQTRDLVGRDTSLFLFFCALFEEDLSQDVLFLAVAVVIFDIVVVGLVEHRVGIVIAVGVLVPDPTHLLQLHLTSACHRTCTVRVHPVEALTSTHAWSSSQGVSCVVVLACKVLASQQQHLLVEPTNYRDLGLSLLLTGSRSGCSLRL